MPDPDPKQQGSAPQGDMSQYIRTYAKDIARLTNQPIPVSAPRPVIPADDGVTLPEVDESPVNRPGGLIRDFKQETLDITKEDSAGIFTQPQQLPPSLPSLAPQPNDAGRRDEVLARLRQKIVTTPPAPPPPPPPAPTFSPFPPAPPQPAPVPPPPSIPPIGVIPTNDGPSPLHTYTSDFANRIDREQASTFTVLAAQSDAGYRTTTTKKKGGAISVVLAVVLIMIGIGGLYAAYVFISSREEPTLTLGVPSLILADEKMELTGPDYRQNLVDAVNQPLVEGNVLITYVTAASTTPLGLASAPQPGGALIRLLNLGAPDILLRNVDLSSTVGVVAAGGNRSPFFILRVNSYERTFAGMLAWENSMLVDLDPLYPEFEIDLPEPIATTTATSTVVTQPLTAGSNFVDTVVSNIDVRVLKDRLGRTLLIYGYSDRDTLIIARDEAAFAMLVARLNATRGGE